MAIQITEELLRRYPKKKDETDRQYTRRVSNIRKSDKYNKWNTKPFSVRLNIKTDKDIIDWLEDIGETKSSYFKRLVREDIARYSKTGNQHQSQ